MSVYTIYLSYHIAPTDLYTHMFKICLSSICDPPFHPPIHLLIYLPTYPYIHHLSVICLSMIYPFTHLSIHQTIHSSTHPSMHLRIYLSIYLSIIYLSIIYLLSIYLAFYLSTYLSLSVYIHLTICPISYIFRNTICVDTSVPLYHQGSFYSSPSFICNFLF
jgi:hypothetical protein